MVEGMPVVVNVMLSLMSVITLTEQHKTYNNNNNNNNICLKSNIQTSSVDYAPRELTHACSRSETCSRSDTEAICVMYFNVNLTDSFDDRRSQCRLIE